jgi:hypothetical protein
LVNWKSQVQLRDLDHAARFELTCRRCGTVRFVTAGELLALGILATCGLMKSSAALDAGNAVAAV